MQYHTACCYGARLLRLCMIAVALNGCYHVRLRYYAIKQAGRQVGVTPVQYH